MFKIAIKNQESCKIVQSNDDEKEVYEGEMRENKKNGLGTLKMVDGSIYKG
jgi:hypothetical protein